MKRPFNVFKHEFWAHYKGLIGWSIGMILLITSSMAKFTTIQGSNSAAQLFSAFPKPFLVIFGISGFKLDTAIGYFGVTFLYIVIFAGIHAAMIGADVIAEEERDHTTEFLMTKPTTRNRVLNAKLWAAFLNILVLNLVTLVTSLLSVAYFDKGTSHLETVKVMCAGLLFLQLLFASVGALFAGIFKNPKLPTIAATGVVLGSYIISVVIGLNDKLDFLKYFTPFRYFDAKTIIDTGGLDLWYIALTFGLIIFFLATTYVVYNKRDLKV